MVENRIFELLRGISTHSKSEDSSVPYLIVGLGNPGKEYEKNRHNVGFMVIDQVIDKFGFTGRKIKSKAIIVEGYVGGKKILLVKPQTFMNLSGEAISSLVRFYKVPFNQIVVIHDDIDLPFGSFRIRPGGGAGGQKGVASIIQRLGTQEFARIRIGVGRPPGRMDAATYVLKNFHGEELKELPFVTNDVVSAIRVFIEEELDSAMNQFNGVRPKEG